MIASTEVGVMRTLPLADGSVVQLNTDSAISVRFTATERRVELVRGEAHFQVTKNPARPFIVSAGTVAVRAVGTAFDVRMRPEAVEVLVTEGKVRVDDTAKGQSLLPTPAAGETPLLIAGERAFIPVGTPVKLIPATVTAVAASEIGQRLAWQARRLEFVATPLSEMVTEFNRYTQHKLVIADARLAQRRFGGTFSAGDNEELVRLLEAEFGVIAEREANETKLRLAP
jgi:transmembrane sensor